MLDRYIGRSNRPFASKKYLVFDSFYYAKYSRYYYIVQTKVVNENYYQSEELLDEPVDENYILIVNYQMLFLLCQARKN